MLAGGVALNCVANGKVLKAGMFDDIWIQPAAGDAGGALGAAYAVWHIRDRHERRSDRGYDAMQGSLLGPEFSNREIAANHATGTRPSRSTYDDFCELARRRRRAAGEGQDHRVVPGPDGVRSARARRPQHSRRRTQPGHAEEDEPQDEVQGGVSAVCADRPRGGRAGALRARPPVALHAAGGPSQGREARARCLPTTTS